MFSCQSIKNIFVEIMKLKFGQDFERGFCSSLKKLQYSARELPLIISWGGRLCCKLWLCSCYAIALWFLCGCYVVLIYAVANPS